MIAPIRDPWNSDPKLLLALCIWREARGEPVEAKRAVVSVLRNRCLLAPAQGFHRDISGNILKPFAFSSFTEGDPNSEKYPAPTDPSWLESLAAAQDVGADLTSGAVFYFSRPLTGPPHCWGPVEHTATMGGLNFYRISLDRSPLKTVIT